MLLVGTAQMPRHTGDDQPSPATCLPRGSRARAVQAALQQAQAPACAQAWKEITLRIREALLQLEARSPPNWVQFPPPPAAEQPALSTSARQV